MRGSKNPIVRALIFVAGLPVLALGVALERPKRALAVLPLFIIAGYLFYLDHAPKAPRDTLTPADTRQIFAALLKRVQPGGVNHLHSRRLYYYAEPFAKAAGASVDAVRAAALLHDSTKENGEGEPKARFCTHGEQGSKYAAQVLLDIGKSKAFAEHVSAAISQHMGPLGFNWRFFDKRFMSKFCDQSFPSPKSLEAKVLYDIDMLDLMTVDGVVKVVTNRQKNPEFEKEPIKDSALTGKDSAWKSVIDARQTLLTDAAQKCGEELQSHSRKFLDGVDWGSVKSVEQFSLAAKEYLAKTPLPSCLPSVPAMGSFGTTEFEGY